MERKNTLYIIAPCYNEEEILELSSKVITTLMNRLILEGSISEQSKLVLIDDGSKDNTWNIISRLHSQNKNILGIKLSRNFGQSSALMAGYMYALKHADMCISLDVDLQDDICVIPKMIHDYCNGAEMVLAIRSSRKHDTFLKKNTAKLFYNISKLLGSKLIPEHPDFRLLSKKALKILSRYQTPDPYIKGIIPLLGLKTTQVTFERKERVGGTTCYNYPKMITLAIHSLIKMSNKLLLLPFLFAVLSIVGLFVKIPSALYSASGFLVLGIFGLYIGEIKTQITGYPAYIIDTITGEEYYEE